MDTGLTTIPEADIEKHRGTAQAMITRIVVLEEGGSSTAALAGTGRRFVPTVSTGGVRKTREVELAKTVAAMRPEDPLLSVVQQTVLVRARRGLAVALAVADAFAQGSALEALQARNKRAPLEGEEAATFKTLQAAAAYVAAFAFASYLLQTIDGEGEPPNDLAEPDYLFDTPPDALKALVAGLDRAVAGAKDDADLAQRAGPSPASPSTVC